MEPTDMPTKHREQNGILRGALQWGENVFTRRFVRNPVQPESLGGLGNGEQQLHAGPGNLQGADQKPDSCVPAGICGADCAVNDEYMPRSVWRNGMVKSLGDYIRQLREVDQQSNQYNVGNKPDLGHQCPRHTERHCNCADDSCADDDIGEQRDAVIRRINQHYDGRSVGQRAACVGANGCKHCGSKYDCVCLGNGQECGLYEKAGASESAAQTTKPR